MIKQIIFIVLISLLYSCMNKVNNNAQVQSDSLDTSGLKIKDSNSTSEIGFMSFFESFMWDRELQKNKVVYPITIEDKEIKASKDWNYLPFYTISSYMPILHFDTLTYFDNDIFNPTITAYMLNFKNHNSTVYSFQKSNQDWKLIDAKIDSINDVPDYEFILFLTKFSEDSIFQIAHTVFPMPNYYADSDNDFETVNGSMQLKDWKHIDLIKHLDKLLIFDLKNNSDYRNIFFRGIENGIFVKYTFNKQNGEWKLIKLEDYST